MQRLSLPRLARVIPVLLALAVPVPATSGPDGSYSGLSTGTGGKKSFCLGDSPIKAQVKGDAISILTVAADGSDSPALGKIDAKGAFAVQKPLKGGGKITYAGQLAKGAITGSWKGPNCFGTFALKK